MSLSLLLNGCQRAESVHESPEQFQQFDELLRNSERLSPGQPKNSFPLDRFLLLEQEVHARTYVGREFSIASTPNERELAEHGARIETLRTLIGHVRRYKGTDKASSPDSCEPYPSNIKFLPEAVKTAVIQYVDEGRPQDVPLPVWEAKEDPAQLACLDLRFSEILQAWESRHAEFSASINSHVHVPNFTYAPEKTLRRFYNWWDLSVSIKDRQDQPVDHFYLKTTADHHSIDDHNSFTCEEGCQFQINAGNEVLNTFHISTRAITSFGPYLVFAHEDAYDEVAGVLNLSFLDLASYGPSIGNAEIPVFRLPVLTTEPVRSLEVRNQSLIVNGSSHVNVEVFMAASELQQIAFNLLANVVDPEQLAEILPYVQSLHTVFEKIMSDFIRDAADEPHRAHQAVVQLKSLSEQLLEHVRNSPKLNEILQVIEKQTELVSQVQKDVQSSKEMQERARRISAQLTASRSMKGQIELFLRKLVSPQPNASLKIRRALVMVGAHRNLEQGRFLNFLADRPWLQMTVVAASVLAATSPSTFMDLLEAGLAFGNGTFDYFKFTLLGLSQAVGKGLAATFAPLTDFGGTLMNQYVYDGNLSRTLIGLSFYVPIVLSTYYVPHLIFNLHKIYLSGRKPDWPGFVENQNLMIHDYYQRLANDEASRRQFETQEKKVKFTAQELVGIREFIENRKATSPAFRPPGRIGRLWMSGRDKAEKLMQAITKSKTVTEDGADAEKIKGIWSAVMSVVFSYPSMELTLTQWARGFNWFAGVRYSGIQFLTLRDLGLKYDIPIFLRPKPITAAVRLLYPDFFNTTVAKRGPKLTVPTDLNGGQRGWEIRDWIWLKESIFGKPSERRAIEEEYEREWTRSELKAGTEAFETEILQVEDAVFQLALQSAMGRLAEFVTDKEQLVELFKDRPIKSAYEKRVREMPAKLRTFLRLYTEEIYIRTMRDYLQAEWNPREITESEIPASRLSLLEIKERLVRFQMAADASEKIQFDSTRATSFAETHLRDEDLFQEIAKKARRGEWSLENWLVNRKYNVIADFDPQQNPSMARYGVVQEKLKSPIAVRRAVISEISKLLITMPLDLAFKMVLSAGVTTGAFKIIQEEFWGPNSLAHFSYAAMYMSMLGGFVMSMAADGWVKIQEDARQDDMGGLGIIPKGQDTTSYFRWYRKQFNDKSNSIWANWGLANTLVFWNIPSGLTLTAAIQLAIAHRIDLSLNIAGYVMALTTPLAGFYYKVDQAFERSVDFASRGIPDERWLAHPEVQEVISKEKQYYRNRFQLLTDLYTNVQIHAQNAIYIIPTDLGTRGFVRSLFKGYLLEELIVLKLLTPARSLTEGIPVIGRTVDALADACEYLLTNGNTDLWKKK